MNESRNHEVNLSIASMLFISASVNNIIMVYDNN